MQHRDALGRRHRQVVIRHRHPRAAPRLRHRLGHLDFGGERVRRPERRRRLVVILRRRLAPRPGQQLAVRADVHHVEPFHHLASTVPDRPRAAVPLPAHCPGGSPDAV